MTYRTALARYSQVVAGRLPAGGSPAGPRAVVQAAVTTATAARFGLRVGTRLNVGPVQLVVTGIIRPAHPAAVFWTDDPGAARPDADAGPVAAAAVLDRRGLHRPRRAPADRIPARHRRYMLVTWVYPVALSQLTADQAGGLQASVDGLASSRDHGGSPRGFANPVSVTIDLPDSLGSSSPFIAAEGAVAPVLELLYVSLAVIGAVVVLLGARLVAQRRAAEFTLMRARGAALHQLGWLALRASALIAAVAGAAAAALAIGLTPGDSDAGGLVAGRHHDRGHARPARC